VSIPPEEVAQVRAATDIVALIGEHCALRQQGHRFVGLCPFHTEKSPSFSVNAQDGFYYCFGCQASGDAITFVREMEHVDFVDAVRSLAARAGITLHETEGGPSQRVRSDLAEAMEAAVVWYHERLLSAPDAGPARNYLRSRGYDGAIVRQFRLGWAPDAWDALSSALKFPSKVLEEAGLAFTNKRGRIQDSFRARVLFPIFDPSGRAVAIGGRILPGVQSDGNPQPKYKNSTETPLYVKRRTLYALNWAKADVIKSNEVVVCEGYTDVIGCFVAGVPRAVATCGTALSEEHFKLLSNFAKRIVLAFDADQAGQSAMGRVYEWEQKFETSVAVASFPPGDDPGELSQRDPEKLRQAIADAVPYLQFRVNRLLSSADLKNAEGRARGAEAALSAVAEHPDPLVRDQYVMMLSDRTAITAQLLRNQLSAVLAQPASERKFFANANATAPSRPVVKEVSSGSRPGLEALRLAVHRPDLVVDRLEAVLFKDPIQREAFLALSNADNLAAAIESVAEESPAVASLLYRLDVEEPTPVDNPALDPADPVMAQLVREGVRRELSLRQGAVRRGEEEIATIAQETAEVRRYLAELDDPINGRAATDWLVAWLMVTSQEDE